MVKKVILTLALVGFAINHSMGQFFSDSTYYNEPVAPPKVILKIDLFSVFDTYSNILIDVEHRLKDDVYLQHGIGFVTGFNDYDFDDDDFLDRPIGFKLRNEIRFYLDFNKGSRKAFYLAPELLYGYQTGDEQKNVGVNCDDDCDFFQRVEYTGRRQEAAIHLKLGTQRIYKEKFSLEYFLGLGYKYKWFDATGLDPNERENVGDAELHPDSEFRYSLTLGFKVGWVVK